MQAHRDRVERAALADREDRVALAGRDGIVQAGLGQDVCGLCRLGRGRRRRGRRGDTGENRIRAQSAASAECSATPRRFAVAARFTLAYIVQRRSARCPSRSNRSPGAKERLGVFSVSDRRSTMPHVSPTPSSPPRDARAAPPSRWRRGGWSVFAVVALLALGGGAASAATAGGYTQAQASAGAAVYTNNCSSCHGANLKGDSGPTLVGPSIASGYKTAAALHDFIKTQMPANAPNSLSAQQYDDVTAYVLAKNGRLGGGTAGASNGGAAKGTVGNVAGTKKGARTGVEAPGNNHLSAEILRAAPPSTKTFAPMPAGANVAITDAMMRGAASDGKDWLIDGRTYDNQRYSPLTQIDTKNVTLAGARRAGADRDHGQLRDDAGRASAGVMYLTTPVVENKMKIMAVNAATGARLWETTYNLGPFQICCGPVNRGPAVAYGTRLRA